MGGYDPFTPFPPKPVTGSKMGDLVQLPLILETSKDQSQYGCAPVYPHSDRSAFSYIDRKYLGSELSEKL